MIVKNRCLHRYHVCKIPRLRPLSHRAGEKVRTLSCKPLSAICRYLPLVCCVEDADLLLWSMSYIHSPSPWGSATRSSNKISRIRTLIESRYLAYMVAVKATFLHNHEKRIDPTVRGSMRVRILEILFDDLGAHMTLRRSPKVRGSVCTTYSRAASLHPQHNTQEANIGRQDRVRTFKSSNFFPGPVA